MIVDVNENASIRHTQYSKLVLLKCRCISADRLEIYSDGYKPITISPNRAASLQNYTCTDSTALAYDCDDEASNWITHFMNVKNSSGETKQFRFAYFDPPTSKRSIAGQVDRQFAMINETKRDDVEYTVGLSDRAAYLITTADSLNCLNHGLARTGHASITSQSFRGNIEISCDDQEPWQEDRWGEIFIGTDNGHFRLLNFMKCNRCPVTMTDPETGKHRKDGQPLKWLKHVGGRMEPTGRQAYYRSPIFGAYFGVPEATRNDTCDIAVGDVVYAKMAS